MCQNMYNATEFCFVEERNETIFKALIVELLSQEDQSGYLQVCPHILQGICTTDPFSLDMKRADMEDA